MNIELCWVKIGNPTSERDRGLQNSQVRSHSTKIQHRRRRYDRQKLRNPFQPHQPLVRLAAGSICCAHSDRQNQGWNQRMSSGQIRPGLSTHKDCLRLQPQHQNNLMALFATPQELRTFQFWLTKSAPLNSQYGSGSDEFRNSTQLLSQMALASDTIRRLVIANGYLHESLCCDSKSSSGEQLVRQATIHYDTALKALINSEPSLEFIAASLLCVHYECFRIDYAAILIHTKGFESALQSYQGVRDSNFETLQSLLEPMTTALRVALYGITTPTDLLEDSSLEKTSAPWSPTHKFDTVSEARQVLAGIIEELSDGSVLDSISRDKIASSLASWFRIMWDWEMQSMWSANRPALLLLFHVTKTLLPDGYTQPSQLQAFLEKAEYHLAESHNLRGQDREEMLLTLRLLVHQLTVHKALASLSPTELQAWHDRLALLQDGI